jgi:hypothetical protein
MSTIDPTRCHFTPMRGEQCGNPPTHTATWPTHSLLPWEANYCAKHIEHVRPVPGCVVTELEAEQ